MKDSNEEKALINIKNINSNKKMILLIIPLLISITVKGKYPNSSK